MYPNSKDTLALKYLNIDYFKANVYTKLIWHMDP